MHGQSSLKRKSNPYSSMKHLSGSFNQLGCHCSPVFPEERNASYNDLHQDQNMEKSRPRQTLMNHRITFSSRRITFEQLGLRLFQPGNSFKGEPPFKICQELSNIQSWVRQFAGI